MHSFPWKFFSAPVCSVTFTYVNMCNPAAPRFYSKSFHHAFPYGRRTWQHKDHFQSSILPSLGNVGAGRRNLPSRLSNLSTREPCNASRSKIKYNWRQKLHLFRLKLGKEKWKASGKATFTALWYELGKAKFLLVDLVLFLSAVFFFFF